MSLISIDEELVGYNSASMTQPLLHVFGSPQEVVEHATFGNSV